MYDSVFGFAGDPDGSRIPWHEVVCLKQSVNASHARGAPILRCSIPSPTGVRRRYSVGSPDTRRSAPHGWPPPQASSSPGHNPSTKRDGRAVSMSGRRSGAEHYPRRVVNDGHAWKFPGCSSNHIVGFRQARFLNFCSNSVTLGGWGSNSRPADHKSAQGHPRPPPSVPAGPLWAGQSEFSVPTRTRRCPRRCPDECSRSVLLRAVAAMAVTWSESPQRGTWVAELNGTATVHTGPTTAQLAQGCYNDNWYPLFKSQADCVQHYGGALNDAGTARKSDRRRTCHRVLGGGGCHPRHHLRHLPTGPAVMKRLLLAVAAVGVLAGCRAPRCRTTSAAHHCQDRNSGGSDRHPHRHYPCHPDRHPCHRPR